MPGAIADIRYGHRERYINELLAGCQRSSASARICLGMLVVRQFPVRSFSERTLVEAGYADAVILDKAGRLPPDTRVATLIADRQLLTLPEIHHSLACLTTG